MAFGFNSITQDCEDLPNGGHRTRTLDVLSHFADVRIVIIALFSCCVLCVDVSTHVVSVIPATLNQRPTALMPYDASRGSWEVVLATHQQLHHFVVNNRSEVDAPLFHRAHKRRRRALCPEPSQRNIMVPGC